MHDDAEVDLFSRGGDDIKNPVNERVALRVQVGT